MRLKSDIIPDMQNLKGRDIAKIFFLTYTTPKKVSDVLYPNKIKTRKRKVADRFIMPSVQNRFKRWKEANFLDKSKPIPIKKKNRWGGYSSDKAYFYLMNLEPVYAFCKEKEIEFTEEERAFLKLLIENERIRVDIIKEFPGDDIINAILKYYVKNLILRYFYLLRDTRENPKKYGKETEKAENLNNPKDEAGKRMKRIAQKMIRELNKRYGSGDRKTNLEWDKIKVASHSASITPSHHIFNEYLDELKGNRKMILSLDEKILRVLKMNPTDLIEVDKTHTPKSVKMGLRPDRESDPGFQRDRLAS